MGVAFQNFSNFSTPPPFHSTESSKSLPAIDAILSTEQNNLFRSPTCDHDDRKPSPPLNRDDDDRFAADDPQNDHFDTWAMSDRLLLSDRPVRKPKPHRNAQSFSTDNLLNDDDASASDSADSARIGERVRFDDSVEKERLVPKRSSLYRRSRSLAEDETRRTLESNDTDFEKNTDQSPQAGPSVASGSKNQRKAAQSVGFGFLPFFGQKRNFSRFQKKKTRPKK